jgi:hypothetical protein
MASGFAVVPGSDVRPLAGDSPFLGTPRILPRVASPKHGRRHTARAIFHPFDDLVGGLTLLTTHNADTLSSLITSFLVRLLVTGVGFVCQLVFAGADDLSGHVTWIIVERSRLFFARLRLIRILVVATEYSFETRFAAGWKAKVLPAAAG